MSEIGLLGKVAIFAQGVVNRALPSGYAENAEAAPRFGRYGEQYVHPVGKGGAYQAADEGCYFIAHNPTSGTGLATQAAPTARTATKPFIMLMNQDTVGGKRVYLDYLKLTVTAAGTAGASLHIDLGVDNGIGRYSSAASMTAAPTNVNMDSNVHSVCLAYGGPIVATAETASYRGLGTWVPKISIPVVGDVYMMTFGRQEVGVGSGVATIAQNCCGFHPVIIGPQQTFLVYLWLPSQSAASSYEVEMGWYER